MSGTNNNFGSKDGGAGGVGGGGGGQEQKHLSALARLVAEGRPEGFGGQGYRDVEVPGGLMEAIANGPIQGGTGGQGGLGGIQGPGGIGGPGFPGGVGPELAGMVPHGTGLFGFGAPGTFVGFGAGGGLGLPGFMGGPPVGMPSDGLTVPGLPGQLLSGTIPGGVNLLEGSGVAAGVLGKNGLTDGRVKNHELSGGAGSLGAAGTVGASTGFRPPGALLAALIAEDLVDGASAAEPGVPEFQVSGPTCRLVPAGATGTYAIRGGQKATAGSHVGGHGQLVSEGGAIVGGSGQQQVAPQPGNILRYPLPVPSSETGSTGDWALTADPMLTDPTYPPTPVNFISRMHDKYDVNKMMEDAPMPGDDSSSESSSNASTSSSTNASPMNGENRMHVPIVQPTVLSVPHSFESMQPLTPGPSDIANLERLNLNTSDDEFGEPGIIQCNRPIPSEIRQTLRRDEEDPECFPTTSWCFVQSYALESKLEGKDFCRQMREFTATTPTFTIYERGVEAPTNLKLDFGIHPKAQDLKAAYGEGIQLSYDKGAVWMTILTNTTMFVLSPFNNFMNGQPLEKVVRYKHEVDKKGNRLNDTPIMFKIFDESEFRLRLSEAARNPGNSIRAHLVRGFGSTLVSVGKGWGPRYGKKFYQTRCFFYLHITQACNAYDALMRSHHTEPVINSRS